MATPLQKAQQAWAWRKKMIKGSGGLIKVATSIPIPKDKLDELYRILGYMDQANNAKFRALGGKIPKVSEGD